MEEWKTVVDVGVVSRRSLSRRNSWPMKSVESKFPPRQAHSVAKRMRKTPSLINQRLLLETGSRVLGLMKLLLFGIHKTKNKVIEVPKEKCKTELIEFPKGKGKVKVNEFLEEKSEEKDKMEKVFARNSLYNKILEQSSRRRVKSIVVGATLLTLQMYGTISWHGLAQSFSCKLFTSIRRTAFKSLVKFVLSIFDVEDFERIIDYRNINNQREQLYKLWAASGIPSLESSDITLVEVFKKGASLHDFSMIREQDVGGILKWFKDDTAFCTTLFEMNQPEFLYYALKPPFTRASVFKESHVKTVMEVMREHVPLKKENKLHLLNDLASGECYCFRDAFAMEFWRDINIIELEKLVIKKKENLKEKIMSVHNDPIYWFEFLVDSLMDQMQWLTDFKASELRHSQDLAAYPLSCGVFGLFEEEVIEVVKQADCERKAQGHHFIGVDHLLSCLLKTYKAEMMQHFEFQEWDEPSAFPIYHIYRSSQDVAKNFGDQRVGLEHLFLAIVFEMSRMDKSQRESFVRVKQVQDRIEDARNILRNIAKEKIHYEAPNLWSWFNPEGGRNYTGSSWSIVKKIKEDLEYGFNPLEEVVSVHNREDVFLRPISFISMYLSLRKK